MRTRSALMASLAAAVVILGGLEAASGSSEPPSAVPRADCGPGSRPETAMQGEVPIVDRRDGRNTQGYSCNLALEGVYQGEGASWVSPSYGDCAYMSTAFGAAGVRRSPGVQVLDVSDPARPRLATTLTSSAMVSGTWESLKVNNQRGLLAAVSGGTVVGGLFFDVYDIATDCARPRLLNRSPLLGGDSDGRAGIDPASLTVPANIAGHEGGWSPDGKTYWASSFAGGSLTAIDVADPENPRIAFSGLPGFPFNHGFSISDDGNRLYAASAFPAGLVVLDIGPVQRRDAVPVIREISRTVWSESGIAQASLPVTFHRTPHLIAFDEAASEGIRILDISHDRAPVVVRHLQLEIQRPENVDLRRAETTGNGPLGYEAHYCEVDRPADPRALACGYPNSGIRVFDIRDPRAPREIAYFNPPAQPGMNPKLPGSEHANGVIGSSLPPVSDGGHGNFGTLVGEDLRSDMSADYCSSPPRFVGEQLWVTCQDNGFLVLRFTNGVDRALMSR